ncbi:MAG: hypothetical protein ACREGR_02865, partial [Minisyncoccia bacterium]
PEYRDERWQLPEHLREATMEEAAILAYNAAAGTYTLPGSAGSPQGLHGGRYLFLISCTGTPTMVIKVAEQGSGTYVSVTKIAGTLASGGGDGLYDLPPGPVSVVVGTSTANYVSVVRVPRE